MKWRRSLRRLLVVCAAVLIAFAVLAWLVGGSLVASANRSVGPAPNSYPYVSVSIQSESGATLSAWFLPSDRATATVVLLHPLRGDRRSMLGRAELLRQAGYATLLVDLQAHGESPGAHLTMGFLERHDAAAAVQYARTRNPHHKIGVIGRSLGGAAALLASPLRIDALVVEAVYPTISEAVHNRVAMRLGPIAHVIAPALLMQLKPRLGVSVDQLRPIDHMAGVQCPILVASGNRDKHTTLSEARRMFDAAPDPKELVVFEGAAHVDLLAYDREAYRKVVSFLDTHLLQGATEPDGIR